jgi:hypothetical protein
VILSIHCCALTDGKSANKFNFFSAIILFVIEIF